MTEERRGEELDAAGVEAAARDLGATDVGWNGRTAEHPWDTWDEAFRNEYRANARAAITAYLDATGLLAQLAACDEELAALREALEEGGVSVNEEDFSIDAGALQAASEAVMRRRVTETLEMGDMSHRVLDYDRAIALAAVMAYVRNIPEGDCESTIECCDRVIRCERAANHDGDHFNNLACHEWTTEFAGSQLAACDEELAGLRRELERAARELGIPTDGYPAPVANAWRIIMHALASAATPEEAVNAHRAWLRVSDERDQLRDAQDDPFNQGLITRAEMAEEAVTALEEELAALRRVVEVQERVIQLTKVKQPWPRLAERLADLNKARVILAAYATPTAEPDDA